MGEVSTKRRFLNDGLYKAVFASATTGGIQDVSRLGLRSHETVTSYRTKVRGGTGTIKGSVEEIFSDSENSIRWPFDNGHEFFVEKVSRLIPDRKQFSCRGYLNSYYSGPLFAVDPWPFWNGYDDPTGVIAYRLPRPEIHASVGTNFLKRMRPGVPQANLVQLITETVIQLPTIPFNGLDSNLHRGLPQLLKNSGSEYLNGVFGWAPLIRDVLKWCRAIVYIDDNLRQYTKDAGKKITRHRRNPDVQTTTETVETDNALPGTPYYPSGVDYWNEVNLFQDPAGEIGYQANGYRNTRGLLTMKTVTTESYWSTSSWMYFLADDAWNESMRTAAFKARHLLGIQLDINLLYELTPWSWLLDWFANVGDILAINNELANDSTVLRYAYLMHKVNVYRTWTHTGVVFGDGSKTGPIRTSVQQDTKERVRATPYGFELAWPEFNPSQLAILAALIATKGGGSSRL